MSSSRNTPKRKRTRLWEALLQQAQGQRIEQTRWPKPPDVFFERMSTGLKQAVDSGVMSVAKDARIDDWRWDPYGQKFEFQVHTWTEFDGTPVNVTTRMHFDPKVAWYDEVERILIESEALVRKLHDVLTRKKG